MKVDVFTGDSECGTLMSTSLSIREHCAIVTHETAVHKWSDTTGVNFFLRKKESRVNGRAKVEHGDFASQSFDVFALHTCVASGANAWSNVPDHSRGSLGATAAATTCTVGL